MNSLTVAVARRRGNRPTASVFAQVLLVAAPAASATLAVSPAITLLFCFLLLCFLLLLQKLEDLAHVFLTFLLSGAHSRHAHSGRSVRRISEAFKDPATPDTSVV